MITVICWVWFGIRCRLEGFSIDGPADTHGARNGGFSSKGTDMVSDISGRDRLVGTCFGCQDIDAGAMAGRIKGNPVFSRVILLFIFLIDIKGNVGMCGRSDGGL